MMHFFGSIDPARIALILLAPVGVSTQHAAPGSEAARRGEESRTNEFLILPGSDLSLADLSRFLGRSLQPHPRLSLAYRFLKDKV